MEKSNTYGTVKIIFFNDVIDFDRSRKKRTILAAGDYHFPSHILARNTLLFMAYMPSIVC